MPIEDVVGAFVAGQLDLLGIDDDDIVAAIHMGCEGGLVLAAQPHRDDRGESAQDQAVGIDQQPFLVDVRRFGGKGFHGSITEMLGGRSSARPRKPVM